MASVRRPLPAARARGSMAWSSAPLKTASLLVDMIAIASAPVQSHGAFLCLSPPLLFPCIYLCLPHTRGGPARQARSPRPPEPLVPLPLGRDDGRGSGLGLGHQLDGLVGGGDGVEGLACGAAGAEQDQGVGGVLLAQGPGPAVGGPEEPRGRGGLEAQGGRAGGLEEGEELRGQLEELVARADGRVVEGDALGVLDGEHRCECGGVVRVCVCVCVCFFCLPSQSS